MIYQNLVQLVGNTPVVLFEGLYLKLEYYNPTGSVKDRPMLYMIKDLEERGIIQKGDTLVEATSGNMGIAMAFLASVLGYKAILVMPESMSVERIRLMEAYGAKVILTSATGGMKESIQKAKEMATLPGHHYLDQFNNSQNVNAHKLTTAQEILKDFDELDFIISGIGTSGTITGLGEVLKQHYPNLKMIGVEPKESAVLTTNTPGRHRIQGIGAGFVPPLLNHDIVDWIEVVASDEAISEMGKLWKKGLYVGISSACAVIAGRRILEKYPDAKILVIIPDHGFKYMSVVTHD
ncbi:MAG: cysteine synthase family protein [Bacilli bacterium]|jgi:cysteine synthase A|nr:cysteine synthase family protein [Bacilli bacterium]HHU24755.1 cysteine synthase family protein [Acholeplasmataceae bacterium]